MPDGTNRAIYATNGMTLKPFPLVNFIMNHFTPDECFIQLSGGEPTLHDAFPFIARMLVENNYQVVINTNGNQLRHLNKSFDINFNSGGTFKPAKWRVSWHNQFRDIEALKKDIEMLDKANVLLNYVAHPKKILAKEIDKDLEDLKNSDYKYEITAFQGKWNDKEYDKNSKIYEPYITALMPDTKSPAIQINYLAIQPNGDVMRCHRVKVGNVYENRLRERYNRNQGICKYEQNNKTSCGLLQSLYLLGLVKKA